MAATASLEHVPRPLEVIHYEGLLDTDPLRINTVESFPDIDHVATLIYAFYGTGNICMAKRLKKLLWHG
jgi:hypothetical protein